MVHGGSMSGTNYTGTPDGREGWAQYFVRQGYAVYVVDQPGRGRSGYLAESYGPWKVADGEGGQRRYLAQTKYKLWPQAHLHTQWPGSGAPDDPVTLQMISGYLPEIESFTKQQFLNRDALVALIDRIGPAILMPRTGEMADFGFQRLPLEHKQARVDDVFRSVARRYDLMNDLMGSPCSIRRAPWTPITAASCRSSSSISARSHFLWSGAPALHNSFSRLRCKQLFAKLQISMKQAADLGVLVLQVRGAEKADPDGSAISK